MTTEVIVSIPYIHPGDEVVVEVSEDTNDEDISKLISTDIIRLVGVKKYTIWGSKHISIHERKLTNE